MLEEIHPGKISESVGPVQLSKREEIQSVKLLKLLPFQVVACFATQVLGINVSGEAMCSCNPCSLTLETGTALSHSGWWMSNSVLGPAWPCHRTVAMAVAIMKFAKHCSNCLAEGWMLWHKHGTLPFPLMDKQITASTTYCIIQKFVSSRKLLVHQVSAQV